MRLTHPFVKKVIAGFRAYVASIFWPKDALELTYHPFKDFYAKFYTKGNETAMKAPDKDKHKVGMDVIIDLEKSLLTSCYVCSGWGHISSDRQKSKTQKKFDECPSLKHLNYALIYVENKKPWSTFVDSK